MIGVHGAVDDGVRDLAVGGQLLGGLEAVRLGEAEALAGALAADRIGIGDADDLELVGVALRV